MSVDQLADTFRRLEAPQTRRAGGRSLDWLFEDRVAGPFLTWFCDNVEEGNLLQRGEAEE